MSLFLHTTKVTSDTFKKTIHSSEFPGIIYNKKIDKKMKRFVPARLVCVCVCVLSCASIAIHVVLGLGQYYISTAIAFSTAP